MFDFLLDETTNDLVITDKDLVFTTTEQESLRQRLSIRLLTYKGEWFLNESYGIPYMQEIIGVTRSKKTVDNILLNNAKLELTASDSISNFESSYGVDARNYNLTFDVSTIEGVVKVDINSDPASEYTYPEPTVFNPYAGCADVIDVSNTLFDYANISGLPATNPNTGLPNDHTWVNNWQNSIPPVAPLLVTNTPLKSIYQTGGSQIYVVTQDGRLYSTGTESYFNAPDNYTVSDIDKVFCRSCSDGIYYRKTNGSTGEVHKYGTPNTYITSVITSSWANMKQVEYSGATALGLRDNGTCVFTYDPQIYSPSQDLAHWRLDTIQALLDTITNVEHISLEFMDGYVDNLTITLVKSDGTVWRIFDSEYHVSEELTLERVGVDSDVLYWGPVVVGKNVAEFYNNKAFTKYQDGSIYSAYANYGDNPYQDLMDICTPSSPCIKHAVYSQNPPSVYVYNGSQVAYQKTSDFISVNKNNIVDMTAIDALYAITNNNGQYKIEQLIIPDGGGYYADYVRDQMSTWVF